MFSSFSLVSWLAHGTRNARIDWPRSFYQTAVVFNGFLRKQRTQRDKKHNFIIESERSKYELRAQSQKRGKPKPEPQPKLRPKPDPKPKPTSKLKPELTSPISSPTQAQTHARNKAQFLRSGVSIHQACVLTQGGPIRNSQTLKGFWGFLL